MSARNLSRSHAEETRAVIQKSGAVFMQMTESFRCDDASSIAAINLSKHKCSWAGNGMSSVCILDYGSGNIGSVANLFCSLTSHVVVSRNPVEISRASHIVLPGVGAFGSTVNKIRSVLPLDVLERAVLIERKPFLGICVGMQVLASRGMEFGEYAGLGWIAGTVTRLEANGLPLPHIGWNDIACRSSSPLLRGLDNGTDFYFVHSFAFHVDRSEQVVATTQYGDEFCSVVQRDNVFGVQFHPEKSQRAGVQLARNFLEYQ